ncbi:extracellular solute-binding protein [Lachnotalea sp. AF33-28]|uniref:extracellular solute-binding protein n=1 Tax=Lachnotalea sp. AF33-28 TaxID=2292046 RepID=UPI000E4D5222|nr:extracellular solute-binding protein [Lachnotalea sp. AF33-28]RHP33938.1 extracellular solute-binding protein [Lachnotalea sp. AF33-28]
MKKFSKAVTLLLAAAMLMSVFAACGKKGTEPAATDTTAAGTPAATTAGAEESTAGTDAATAEKPHITFMTTDHYGTALTNKGADEVKKVYEEYTNTIVDWTWVSNDNYEDVLGITLMDKQNMPMVLTITGTIMSPAVIQAAKNDAFWDLNQFIWDEEKYPNLSQANKDVCKSYTLDGKLIGLYRARDIGRNGLGYRTDWAEKLGLDVPKTIEDVYNMAYQFTYGDPDGNGKDDTYGISMCKFTGPIDIVQAWFGAGNGWTDRDGKLVPVHMTEEYMEAVNWFKRMYDEKLIYEDWAVRDTIAWKDYVRNGECGMFLDVLDTSRSIWDYFIDNKIPSVFNPDEYAGMTLVGGIAKDANSEPVTLATSGANGYFVISKAACKTEEEVETCLRFLDKMNDPEMVLLGEYGLEGKDWEYGDDGLVHDLQSAAQAGERSSSGLNQCQTFVPGKNELPVARTERVQLEMDIKEANIDIAVFNPAMGYLANSTTYAENGGDLDDILLSARTQYICGNIDQEEFQKQLELWLSRGGQAVIDEVNEQYQADK